VVGGVQTGDISSLDTSSLSTATGLIGGIVSSTTSSLLGTSIPSYAALFRALADSSRTNIVSTPVLLALDNEQAKYKVGQNIPYKKGVLPTTTTTATSSLTTNIDRQDLLLELDVKPHISTNDSVLLELKLSSEDLGDTTNELGPSWTTRSFETRVLVRDQSTIVIGGLAQEREVSTTSSVPVLGSIPLLGYLFKYSSKTKKKTTLLVMMTPYIIKDQSELEEIRARKAREYDEFVGSLKTFSSMAYQPHINYGRKRGLLEEINRTVLNVEEEAALRAKLATPDQRISGPVAP
jgi:general secretion pathway protein D